MLLQTPEAQIGDKIIPFDLTDPDGNSFALDGLKGKNGTLIAFICNHCPYVQAIIDRLVADAKVLKAEGIEVIAINPNDFVSYPADSPANMREFSKRHGFQFPYLIDEDQSVARAYSAVCTPDFFGYNANGELQYRGRLDDAKMGEASQRTAELLTAMKQVGQTGSGPGVQHASMGCSIKWKPGLV